MTVMPKTADPAKRKAYAAAERERAAAIKATRARLNALPDDRKAAVMARADDLRQAEIEHRRPRAAHAYIADALAELEPEPAADPPKAPRERSKPKEAGRPKPETKDADRLAANAKTARGGDEAIAATVTVTVPAGEQTKYCPACDTTKPLADFLPKNPKPTSKARGKCRTCYNAAWAEWDRKRREQATA